jgi:aromatic ring-opening dioxygenase catalytic subunit (LigB family)
MKKQHQYRTLFISHGGGPLPLLGDTGHQEMVSLLQKIRSELPKPSAILLISAHWEQKQPTLTGSTNPGLLYDYYGFPEESYNISYPAPGEPHLAQEIYNLLDGNALQPVIDNSRSFDHGMFIPLKIMYPEADIPCVQLSLVNSLDSALHIKIGEALADIQYKDLLIIGSGFSFHNMQAFFSSGSMQEQSMNEAFEAWLIETCTDKNIDEADRKKLLTNWEKAPHARFCHPREEHLLPLHVCYGLNSSASYEVYRLRILGKSASFYLW